jgi:hypothetical protein
MQVIRSLLCLGLASAAALGAQEAQPRSSDRPERIISDKYRFSVALPRGWYVVGDEDPPLFFNFPAERMLPQGELPTGGASISIRVEGGERQNAGNEPMSTWADHEAEAVHGINVAKSFIDGPPVTGASRALYVVFSEPALGEPGQSLGIVIVLWRFGEGLFAAELSYISGDPKGKLYGQTLIEVARSFRPGEPRPKAR